MKKRLCAVLCLLCLSPLFAYAERSPQAQKMLLENRRSRGPSKVSPAACPFVRFPG